MGIGPRGPIDKFHESHKVIRVENSSTRLPRQRCGSWEDGVATPSSHQPSANRRSAGEETEGSRVVLSTYFPVFISFNPQRLAFRSGPELWRCLPIADAQAGSPGAKGLPSSRR